MKDLKKLLIKRVQFHVERFEYNQAAAVIKILATILSGGK